MREKNKNKSALDIQKGDVDLLAKYFGEDLFKYKIKDGKLVFDNPKYYQQINMLYRLSGKNPDRFIDKVSKVSKGEFIQALNKKNNIQDIAAPSVKETENQQTLFRDMFTLEDEPIEGMILVVESYVVKKQGEADKTFYRHYLTTPDALQSAKDNGRLVNHQLFSAWPESCRGLNN